MNAYIAALIINGLIIGLTAFTLYVTESAWSFLLLLFMYSAKEGD